MFDGEVFGAQIVEAVKAHVERATAPLLARIAELEGRQAIDVEQFMAQIIEQSKAAAENAAKLALDARPLPQDGKDGLDAPEVTPDQIDASVARYLEVNPPPAGRDGADGKDGRDGIDGAKGDPGEDGVGLASALIDKDGHLIITTTRGAVLGLGEVVGRDGKDGEKGEPGRDGLTLSDFDTSLSEDGRILTLSLESDELRITHELQLPTMIYRGVWKEGAAYVEGDTVTWAGSGFVAKRETTDKPETSDAWQLAIKRGRDAK